MDKHWQNLLQDSTPGRNWGVAQKSRQDRQPKGAGRKVPEQWEYEAGYSFCARSAVHLHTLDGL